MTTKLFIHSSVKMY